MHPVQYWYMYTSIAWSLFPVPIVQSLHSWCNDNAGWYTLESIYDAITVVYLMGIEGNASNMAYMASANINVGIMMMALMTDILLQIWVMLIGKVHG